MRTTRKRISVLTLCGLIGISVLSGCSSGQSRSTVGFDNALSACALVGVFYEGASGGANADADMMNWALTEMVPEARAAGRLNSSEYGLLQSLAVSAQNQYSSGSREFAVTMTELAAECQRIGFL